MDSRHDELEVQSPRHVIPAAAAYVVEVVTQPAGKLYPYLAPPPPPALGTAVVVESERGTSLAWVALTPRPATAEDMASLPSLIRLASAEDLNQEDRNREREDVAFKLCLRLIDEQKLQMKLVRVHYLVGATKAVFYFTAEGRVDFRTLVRLLAADLRLRIEMRQIGVRDETKILGGVGHCGRELCCSTWLRTFVPVSIRMAKDQNLALNPQKVSGACGRLMCCLAYEHETYVELKRTLPKVGKRVNTTSGLGRITNQEVLKQRFVVELDNGGRLLLSPDDLLPLADGQDEPDSAPSETAADTYEV
ncbi:MAG: stage 0 sporulation family protein [Myxococcota bacterium]